VKVPGSSPREKQPSVPEIQIAVCYQISGLRRPVMGRDYGMYRREIYQLLSARRCRGTL
jgi:hypothetical protein